MADVIPGDGPGRDWRRRWQRVTCSRCYGSGGGDGELRCGHCDGSGEVWGLKEPETRPALTPALALLCGDASRTFRDAVRGEFVLRDDGVYLPRDNRTRPWSRTPATRTPVGRNDDGSVRYDEREAHTITPAEALEMLRDAALWPWEIGDESAPRWWCEACDGSGTYPDNSRDESCGLCVGTAWNDRHDEWGTLAAPRTLPEVVAVASLGAERLRQIHEHVERLHMASPEIGRSLVWRVMTAEQLREHHEQRRAKTYYGRGKWLCAVFSVCVLDGEWSWTGREDVYGDDLVLLSALHRCGVHLIDATPARVVIGVEGVA